MPDITPAAAALSAAQWTTDALKSASVINDVLSTFEDPSRVPDYILIIQSINAGLRELPSGWRRLIVDKPLLYEAKSTCEMFVGGGSDPLIRQMCEKLDGLPFVQLREMLQLSLAYMQPAEQVIAVAASRMAGQMFARDPGSIVIVGETQIAKRN